MRNNESRARDKTVTTILPILVPGAGVPAPKGLVRGTLTRSRGEAGTLFIQDGSATITRPVAPFRVPKIPPKRFEAMAKMLSLATGKPVDVEILRNQLPHLFRDAFPERMVNLLIQKAIESPQGFAARWLEPIFNKEIADARLVMWSSRRQNRPSLAIYCPNDETALFIHLLTKGISACLGCSKLFVPDRPNQVYHDLRCANRHRKRRERLAKGTAIARRNKMKKRRKA